jgi:hypothetical protein
MRSAIIGWSVVAVVAAFAYVGATAAIGDEPDPVRHEDGRVTLHLEGAETTLCEAKQPCDMDYHQLVKDNERLRSANAQHVETLDAILELARTRP